jgi:hypothetical protein
MQTPPPLPNTACLPCVCMPHYMQTPYLETDTGTVRYNLRDGSPPTEGERFRCLSLGSRNRSTELYLGKVAVVQAAYNDPVLAEPPAQQGTPGFVAYGPRSTFTQSRNVLALCPADKRNSSALGQDRHQKDDLTHHIHPNHAHQPIMRMRSLGRSSWVDPHGSILMGGVAPGGRTISIHFYTGLDQ